MIIAFMGDTFDKMMELKPIFALQQQMRILSFSRMIMGQEEDHGDEQNRFLYVVEPVKPKVDGY